MGLERFLIDYQTLDWWYRHKPYWYHVCVIF